MPVNSTVGTIKQKVSSLLRTPQTEPETNVHATHTCEPMVLLRQDSANMAPALRFALMGESRSKGFFFSGFLRRIFSRSYQHQHQHQHRAEKSCHAINRAMPSIVSCIIALARPKDTEMMLTTNGSQNLFIREYCIIVLCRKGTRREIRDRRREEKRQREKETSTKKRQYNQRQGKDKHNTKIT